MSSFITSSAPNSTSSSATSHQATGTRPPFFEPSSSDAQFVPNAREKAFNYYFLILAAFVLVLAVGLGWLRLRKRRQKEQARQCGRNALARDLQNWSVPRRWTYGTRGNSQCSTASRREEGLDERGEAPPPYCPKTNVTLAPNQSGEAQDAATGLSIPLRTFSLEEVEHRRPPAYQESAVNVVGPRTSLDASNSQTARSERE